MGNVEDIRKVVQDFVAPDLKALEARLIALEKDVKVGFEQADRSSVERFANAEKLNQERFASLSEKLSSAEKIATIRHEVVMSALEMEKRIARLESARSKGEAQHA